MLVVLLGFSLIFSATLLAISGIKLPQWLGVYNLSALQILKDTSDLAPRAVRALQVTDGDGVTPFRYQVRLGVGYHFFQFTLVLLPFCIGLRWWVYLLSILLGVAYGHAVLLAVFVCRQRFRRRRGAVAMGAAVLVLVTSAWAFEHGMYVVEKGWNRRVGNDEALFLALSFLVWLACCGVGLCARYYGQRRFSTGIDDDEARLFDDAAEETEGGDVHIEEGPPEISAAEQRQVVQEPLLDSGSNHRNGTRRDSLSRYLYDSVLRWEALDRVKFPRENTESLRGNAGIAPEDIYEAFAAKYDTDMAWYHRLWNFLPARPLRDLFAMSARNTFGCCRTDSVFHKFALYQKGLFILLKLSLVCLDLLAIYVVIVSCGATVQRRVTMEKLWYPQAKLYGPRMNEGPVCAFNDKCGNIQKFPSNEDASSVNYTIAHCGPCGSCSNWNDLSLQTTDLATPANACAQKHLFDGVSGIASCIERDIGFTKDCALDWAKNIECSKKHCAFIFMQSLITNQVGNFEVGPNTITSATCSEASCEAGNPGNFVGEVGANRRRMNILSEIARPASQQCAIVGIPKNSENYSNWVEFMDPEC